MTNSTIPRLEPTQLNPRRPSRRGLSPTPQWSTVFHNALAQGPGGYAYCVLRYGQLVDSGSWGYARMPQDSPDNRGVPFTIDSRCNLASVSKTITATAVFGMVQNQWVPSVNTRFWPLVSPYLNVKTPAAGVDSVTIAELLTMNSRLPEDGTLYTNLGLQGFVADYLSRQALVPRQLDDYSNTNFSILEVLVDALCQKQSQAGYLQWVQNNVLTPLGIDTSVFSPVPDSITAATLSYDPNDPTAPGVYWPEMQCVGPGGWIASASTLATYLGGFRGTAVLQQQYIQFMMSCMLGWYPGATTYGLAYHHNGGLIQGGAGLNTGLISFPDGYDAVLLVNKPYPDIIPLMLEAFDASPANART